MTDNSPLKPGSLIVLLRHTHRHCHLSRPQHSSSGTRSSSSSRVGVSCTDPMLADARTTLVPVLRQLSACHASTPTYPHQPTHTYQPTPTNPHQPTHTNLPTHQPTNPPISIRSQSKMLAESMITPFPIFAPRALQAADTKTAAPSSSVLTQQNVTAPGNVCVQSCLSAWGC